MSTSSHSPSYLKRYLESRLKIISLAAAIVISCPFAAMAQEEPVLDEAKLATIEGELAKHGLYTQLFHHEIPKIDGVDNIDAYLAKVIERNMEQDRTIRATLSFLASNKQANSAKTDAALVKCLNYYFDKEGDQAREEVIAEVGFVLQAIEKRSAISMIDRKRDGLFFYPDAYVQEVFLRALIPSKEAVDQKAVQDFMALPKDSIKVSDKLLVELGLLKELPVPSPKAPVNPNLPRSLQEE